MAATDASRGAGHERRALVIAIAVTVAAVLVSAIGWVVMWRASVWISPTPAAAAAIGAAGEHSPRGLELV